MCCVNWRGFKASTLAECSNLELFRIPLPDFDWPTIFIRKCGVFPFPAIEPQFSVLKITKFLETVCAKLFRFFLTGFRGVGGACDLRYERIVTQVEYQTFVRPLLARFMTSIHERGIESSTSPPVLEAGSLVA